MTHAFFEERRPHNGMDYEEYLAFMEENIEEGKEGRLEGEYARYAPYFKLQLRRSKRIAGTYRVSPEVRKALSALCGPQLWMVITEPWCGDSAQNLPYIAAIASLSDRVHLRILLRDQNPDIMDRYLTGGTRSIPILVAFDEQGRELFRWGPRPRPAAELFREEKAKGLPKEEILEKLHSWYAKDNGATIEAELRERLRP